LEGRTNKDRGRVRRDRSRAPHRNPTLAKAAAFRATAARQWGRQSGKQSPGLHNAIEEPGQREAGPEQPHTWLANAGNCGGVPPRFKPPPVKMSPAAEMAPNAAVNTRQFPCPHQLQRRDQSLSLRRYRKRVHLEV
jgi:hypothetical protein